MIRQIHTWLIAFQKWRFRAWGLEPSILVARIVTWLEWRIQLTQR